MIFSVGYRMSNAAVGYDAGSLATAAATQVIYTVADVCWSDRGRYITGDSHDFQPYFT